MMAPILDMMEGDNGWVSVQGVTKEWVGASDGNSVDGFRCSGRENHYSDTSTWMLPRAKWFERINDDVYAACLGSRRLALPSVAGFESKVHSMVPFS